MIPAAGHSSNLDNPRHSPRRSWFLDRVLPPVAAVEESYPRERVEKPY